MLLVGNGSARSFVELSGDGTVRLGGGTGLAGTRLGEQYTDSSVPYT